MLKRPQKIIILASAALTLLLGQGAAHAATLSLPESPLFVSGFADPNIMFLVDDSGSMRNIVPDTPYDPDPDASEDITCPTDNALAEGTHIFLRVTSSGSPYFRVFAGEDHSDYDWGTVKGTEGLTGKSVRCFDPNTDYYMAKLYAEDGSAGETKTTKTNAPAQYTGRYLNWFFGSVPAADCASYTVGTQSTSWGEDARTHPCAKQRMAIAKEATTTLVEGLSNVRAGLASYNGSSGASIDVGVDDIADNRSAMLTKIDALAADGRTPLAESLHQIGRYFIGGYTGSLLLHPGESKPTQMGAYTVFHNPPSYAHGVSKESPIQAFCQKNFAVLLTDGRPRDDQDINRNSGLRDYDGDCSGENSSACYGDYDQKIGQDYEKQGSDFLDDVAMALFEIDLRPDLDDFDGNEVVNNIVTYTIGFADDQVINDPLMQDTADNGGGLFLQAANAADLATAFATATADIFSKGGSAAAVAASSGSVRTGSRIYQGRFNSGDWSGQLLSIPVNPDGTLDDAEWDAADILANTAWSDRKILTYNPGLSSDPPSPPTGIPFRFDSLNEDQQLAMNTAADGTTVDGKGKNRTDYIRGDATDESPEKEGYRPRATPLGDIINSAPIYIGSPPFDYPDGLEGTGGKTYSEFKTSSVKDRTPVVYVGANDGMLHGFDASVSSDNKPTNTSGQEVIAYIPSQLIPKLSKLTDSDYTHQTYVDASPIVGDIYAKGKSNWITLLAGALGRGGQGLYGLDITDPGLFGEDHVDTVLWEFTDADDPDLGYVYGRPAIVRMAPADTGEWAVVTGNGYNNSEADGAASTSGNAVLFVINAETGALIRKIDTDPDNTDANGGTAVFPNTLASPAPVDFDGDNIVDLIYAGDLNGNLWKFDVTNSDPASWSASKLFTAVDASGNPQPITTQVEVSRHLTLNGFMIYFGTGKYLEDGDTKPAGAKTQTFYGIWDNLESGEVTRADLHVQTILEEVDNPFNSDQELRITSADNAIDWSEDRGWRLDLLNTEDGNTNNQGERVITSPVYLHPSRRFPTGRILFTTLIPDDRTCGFGGTGWLMEVDPNSGSRLDRPPFDINGKGTADHLDLVDGEVSSGKRNKGAGMPSRPEVMLSPQGEFIITNDTHGDPDVTTGAPPFTGRTSWREAR